MKQKLKFIVPFALVFLLVVAALTNPNEANIRADLKIKVYQELQLDTANTQVDREITSLQQLGAMFQQSFMKPMVDSAITKLLIVQRYWFFSLLKVSYQDEEKWIGVAAFNQVFLMIDLKKIINEQLGLK